MANDALRKALKESGARGPTIHEIGERSTVKKAEVQGSRQGTKAITVHFPEEVRRTLKELAGREGRHVDDMVAEALNMLFVKHGKPEVAPRKIN